MQNIGNVNVKILTCDLILKLIGRTYRDVKLNRVYVIVLVSMRGGQNKSDQEWVMTDEKLTSLYSWLTRQPKSCKYVSVIEF